MNARQLIENLLSDETDDLDDDADTVQKPAPDRRIDWDQVKHRYSHGNGLHRIDLSDPSGALGHMAWDDDDGVVSSLFVGEKVRRSGLATHLWELATDLSREKGFTPPEHSDARTEAGDAFAHSIGGYIPRLADDVDGWSGR